MLKLKMLKMQKHQAAAKAKVWNDSEINILIDFMLENPGFYDVSDGNFKKLIYRKQKLHELSETKLKRFNRIEISNKMNVIRKYYISENKKIKNSQAEGMETPYTPKWKFYDKLAFLEPLVNKNTKKNKTSTPPAKIQVNNPDGHAEGNDMSKKQFQEEFDNTDVSCNVALVDSEFIDINTQIEPQRSFTASSSSSLFQLEEKFLLELPKNRQLPVINKIRQFIENEISKAGDDEKLSEE